jgi:hypothetical protein
MALPSEGSETSEIQHLGESLGKSPCIELQGVSRALPKPADRLAELRDQMRLLKDEEQQLREAFIAGADPVGDDYTVTVDRKTIERVDLDAMRQHIAEEVWKPFLVSKEITYVNCRRRKQ